MKTFVIALVVFCYRRLTLSVLGLVGVSWNGVPTSARSSSLLFSLSLEVSEASYVPVLCRGLLRPSRKH